MADELGSIRAITNSSGSITGTFTYDAWGNKTGSTGSVTSPFGFAGEYLDGASGFYYLRARWYDAGTGQFMSLDPAVQTTMEPYQYVGNDPLNGTDPSGLCKKGQNTMGCKVVDPHGTSVTTKAYNQIESLAKKKDPGPALGKLLEQMTPNTMRTCIRSTRTQRGRMQRRTRPSA